MTTYIHEYGYIHTHLRYIYTYACESDLLSVSVLARQVRQSVSTAPLASSRSRDGVRLALTANAPREVSQAHQAPASSATLASIVQTQVCLLNGTCVYMLAPAARLALFWCVCDLALMGCCMRDEVFNVWSWGKTSHCLPVTRMCFSPCADLGALLMPAPQVPLIAASAWPASSLVCQSRRATSAPPAWPASTRGLVLRSAPTALPESTKQRRASTRRAVIRPPKSASQREPDTHTHTRTRT